MEFIVSSFDEIFNIHKIDDGEELIFCAFFEDGGWWYRGRVNEKWRSLRFYSTDYLLLALYNVDRFDIDVKTFVELNREMTHFCATNYPDMLEP